MSVTVRPYRPEDRAACARVFYRAVREGAAAAYDQAQREAWAPSPEPDLATPDKLRLQWCWVAERGGAVAGFMSIEPSGYLDMAFVLPEEMGKGTADALYSALMARVRDEGLSHLTVTASHLARRFFARHGWTLDRKEDLAADGQIYEVFRMSLDLTPTEARDG
ncbi:MAG: GNAT family N-acetyltransferase [Albidovulum sp.]